jgi:DNA-binding Xre family transcriptional regulator
MKDKLLKCLETMTKSELSKEIGISSQTLTKILSQGLSTVRIDSFNKVKQYCDFLEVKDKIKKVKESEKILNNKVNDTVKEVDSSVKTVKVEVEIPELDYYEARFVDRVGKSTVEEKVSALGYLNYVLKAKTTEFISWRKDLMQGKSFSDIDDIVDRVGRAILCGAYILKKDTKEVYYIKLPSGHYLCKYDNGFTGWTVEPNKFTVSSEVVDELKNSYPEYTDFISKEEVISKPMRKDEKKVGFTISERIGKTNKRVANFRGNDTNATSKKNGLRW